MNDQEGCLVEGTVVINKVPGNFHLSTHAYGDVVQQLYMSGKRLDFTHKINHLSFGDDKQMKEITKRFGETFVFDLDGVVIDQQHYLYQGQMLANYYLDINEIEFYDQTRKTTEFLEGYKHKSTRSILAQLGLPALFFRYELSPIKLRYTVSYKAWYEFLINICAIIGGLFTVASILESFFRNTFNIVRPSSKDN